MKNQNKNISQLLLIAGSIFISNALIIWFENYFGTDYKIGFLAGALLVAISIFMTK